MRNLGNRRRGKGAATLVAGFTAVATALIGLSAGQAGAAPSSLGERAKTISNQHVEIEPAEVKGTYTDPDTGQTGRVVARFMPKEFKAEDGTLSVDGVLTGVFTGKLPEGTPRHFSQPVSMDVLGADAPGEATTSGAATGGLGAAGLVQASSHGCDILNLDLGPLDLNLLGLQVDLAPVVLDIVAQPGAGELLGNLLCAVAGLLDPGSALGDVLDGLLANVAALLNGLLGGSLDEEGASGLVEDVSKLLGGAQTQAV
jgi:hypothetical protein